MGELHKQVYMPVLMQHPMLSKLDQRMTDSICHLVVTQQHYNAGHKVFGEGDEASSMLFVVSGELTYYIGKSGKAVLEGQWICEAVMWSKWIHPGWLITTTSCELFVFNSAKFLAVMAEAEKSGSSLSSLRTYAELVLEQYVNVHPRTDVWDDGDGLEGLARTASSQSLRSDKEQRRQSVFLGAQETAWNWICRHRPRTSPKQSRHIPGQNDRNSNDS